MLMRMGSSKVSWYAVWQVGWKVRGRLESKFPNVQTALVGDNKKSSPHAYFTEERAR